MGLYSEEGSLRPTPPFDFAKSLAFLGMFPPMREDQTVSELSMTKAVRVGGRAIVFQLKPTGTIKMPGLKYTLFADHPLSRGLTEVVIDRISFFLSLSDDLDQFYRIAINDSNFAPVLQKLYGLHQVKFLTPFECACWAVLSQRNQLSAARRAKQALLERFGTSLGVKGHVYRAFPEPGQLADASKEELKSLIKHERREEYLGNVIRAFNEVDERFLRTTEYDKVEEWQRRAWLTAYATGWCRVNWNAPYHFDHVHAANYMAEHGVLPVKISATVNKIDEKLGATAVRGSCVRHRHISFVVVE